VYGLVGDCIYLVVTKYFLGSPCISKKVRRRKIGENLRSRGPNDPSVIAGPKISDVGMLCRWYEDSAPETESKWDEGRRLDFGNDRRRLERLKTVGMVLESD